MAAAAPQRWADLQLDMVIQIVLRVPCPIDRARMAVVCREWHTGVVLAPRRLPPPLPSLLLSPGDATDVYCYLSGCRAHNTFPGPRHFGSFDGAWVLLAYGQTRGHRVLNVITGDSYNIPDDFKHEEEGYHTHAMAVLGATLSHPPDDPKCVVGAIITYQPDADAPRQRHFAFSRPWDETAIAYSDAMPDAPVGPGFEPEDVVYHRGSFHFLIGGEHVLVFTPTLDEHYDITENQWVLLRFQDRGSGCDEAVRARYLVESRGELLMVVRLAPHPQAPTSSFKVFQKVNRPMPGDMPDEYFWRELDVLGGRMLFVGRGCSRCYDVVHYPGFKDAIYFMDEGTFYDDEMMFRRVHERQYPCSDTGKWSQGPPPHVDHYFPERAPSNNSPPVWLLPLS